MSKTTHIVVHYSATYDDQDIGVADIDKMHRARGFRKVGYHFVIRLDGTVEKGREEWETGAHVGGQNTGKVGICCIGGLKRATGASVGVDTRTDAQKAALAKLIRELLVRHPGADVVGHRDLAATQCPAFDVRVWWASVNTDRPSMQAPVRTGGVSEDAKHVVERGDTLYSIAVAHGLRVESLAAANGLNVHADVIRPGQVLDLVAPRPKQTNADAVKGAPSPPPAPVASGGWLAALIAFLASLRSRP